ncbi:MAG: flagellar hook-basal body complex protein [Candidatus Sphingomonas phytovorans]|nr:flagellar hook-basal body complex protein [Sphingomonas sp.]WEJ98145.1 MAG: flagellar hook-basal body complex protein [Sphingomonas sp.]
MFGSIYIGLSGLNAYSKGLQQVSNNVSNLNSQGFKSSTVSFEDVVGIRGNGGLSYASSGGSGGHGVTNAGTRIDLKQGELRQTERDLDLSVDGAGFLMLLRGEEVAYTRTGSFQVGKDGFIMLTGTEYRLAMLDASGRPVSVSVDTSSTSVPKATTKITFSDNLSSDQTTFSVNDVKVVDKNGVQRLWQVKLDRSTTATGEWTVTVRDGSTDPVGTATLKFINGIVDPSTAKLTITDTRNNSQAVVLDFTTVTSFSGGTTQSLRASSVDGYKLGTITSVSVNEKGELEVGYSNEQKVQLGAIALADFRDPQALKQKSGGLFTDGGNAGRQLLTSTDDRVGTVLSRRLEASNVDLSREFGDLILIQRGFQASSQIISVTNDMIQQLFGIRGQG